MGARRPAERKPNYRERITPTAMLVEMWGRRSHVQRVGIFNRRLSGQKARFAEIDRRISSKEGEIKTLQEKRSGHFLPSYLELGKLEVVNQYINEKINTLENMRWMARSLLEGTASELGEKERRNIIGHISRFTQEIDELKKEHATNRNLILESFGKIEEGIQREKMKRKPGKKAE